MFGTNRIVSIIMESVFNHWMRIEKCLIPSISMLFLEGLFLASTEKSTI